MSNDSRSSKPGAGSERAGGGVPRDDRRADPGGDRSKAGSNYGDFVPDSGQPRRNDDRDQQPGMGGYYTGGGDLEHMGESPKPVPEASDVQPDNTPATGSADEQVPDPDEAAHESKLNKSFDTPHVHSGTTSRKV